MTLFHVFVNSSLMEQNYINCLLFAHNVVLIVKKKLPSLLDRELLSGAIIGVSQHLTLKMYNIIHHRTKFDIIFSLGVQNFIQTTDSNMLEMIEGSNNGTIIDKYVNYKTCLNILAQSGTRALGSLIHKNMVIDLSYNTFTMLYNDCVLPVITVRCSVLKTHF